jgi:hypothetical protein
VTAQHEEVPIPFKCLEKGYVNSAAERTSMGEKIDLPVPFKPLGLEMNNGTSD